MKRVVSVVLAMLIVATMFVLPASAEGKKSGLFTYEIKGNGTAVITGFDWESFFGNFGDIYIPRMVDGYTLTGIGDNAFNSEYGFASTGESIAVILPDTITTIGEKAFFGFEGIASINIPASVQSIGYGAFANCSEDIIFSVDGGSGTFATIDGVLYNKQLRELIACPRGIESLNIPEGIVSIGDYACYNIDIAASKITLPSTLSKIGNHAFASADMGPGSFVLPESLTHIGEYAFSDAVFYTEIHIEVQKVIYALDVLYIPHNVNYIGEGAFMNCDRTGHGGGYSALIMDNCPITEIPAKAFENVRFYKVNFEEPCGVFGTTILKWPEKLETIGDMAFKDAEVGISTIPKGIKKIGDSAFENAFLFKYQDNSLTNPLIRETVFTIPEGVESVGTSAFAGCDLQTIVLPNSLSQIGDNICDRTKTRLEVESGSYAALWASENGYPTTSAGNDDTSWLNG